MIQLDKVGIYLSKPVAFLMVLIYLVQSALLVYLITDKFDLERQISFQQNRIHELQERLQVFDAIDDFQIGFSEEEVGRLADVVYTESKKYNYDPMFVVAIILTESSFRRGQVSSKGARGLMQVMPFVGKDLAERMGMPWSGAQSLHEPQANIKLGTLHLFEQILEFRDIEKALLAYNMGETRLRGLLRNEKELPQNYIKKVLEYYKKLKETYQA